MTQPAYSGHEAAREAALAFDLRRLNPEFLDNPFPTYHQLRTHDPVHRCPDGSVFLTRYADVAAVYRDKRMSSDKQVEFRPKFGDGGLWRHHTTSLVFNDPPYHDRVRRLLMPAFAARTLKALEPGLVALVERLLDEAAERGGMDLIADFASAVPVEVICNMLGVPREHRAPLRGYSLKILRGLEPVISERRKHLNDDSADALSSLIRGEPNSEDAPFTQEELIQNCIFLLNAGHETTTNLIGNGVAALIDFPDQLALLQAQPGLIDKAVEEFLRYESSNQLGNRRVIEDAEIGGEALPAGTLITLCIGAANRDPAVFADPDRLDITRWPNRHLAFGAGIHACAGMHLARLEARIAIGRLVRRFPTIHRSGAFVRGGRARFRGYASYPVSW